MDGILEQIPLFFGTILFTASAYILYFKSERFVGIIISLTETVEKNIQEEDFCRIVYDYSKKIVLMITTMWSTGFICLCIFILPLLLHILGESNTSEKLLPLKSWYPFDRRRYPYFYISSLIEILRMIGILNLNMGAEILFMVSTFQVANQFFILSEKITNIFERVKKMVRIPEGDSSKENCEESIACNKIFIREMNRELKEYIMQHISLTK